MTIDGLKAIVRTTKPEPWPEEKKQQLSRTAWQEYFSHSYRHARRDPDNCAACALQVRPEPNYAGWLRLFIQSGVRAPRKVMLAEAERARTENEPYFAAMLRDIKTYQPGWVK